MYDTGQTVLAVGEGAMRGTTWPEADGTLSSRRHSVEERE